MDYQMLFNIIMGVAAAMGGWIVGRVTKALDQLDLDVRNMPQKYVSREDHNRSTDQIMHKLDLIFDKLDEKADK